MRPCFRCLSVRVGCAVPSVWIWGGLGVGLAGEARE